MKVNGRNDINPSTIIVHTYDSSVDPESLKEFSEDSLVCIEIQQIPIADATNLSYTLPIHLRYHMASYSDSSRRNVTIESPTIISKYPSTSSLSTSQLSLSISKICDITHLNNTGNAYISMNLSAVYGYHLSSTRRESVIFFMPIGNQLHYQYADMITSATIVCTTIILLVVLLK